MADAAAGQSEAVQQQEVVAAVQEELMKDVASLEAAGFASQLVVVEAGEQQKTPATIALIHDAAFERNVLGDVE